MEPISLAFVLALSPILGAQDRDPRRWALTPDDALLVIPDVTGRVVAVGDIDGDGHRDLFVERGGRWWSPERIEILSGSSGATIRTLWRLDPRSRVELCWDAGGDVDGDGVGDLLIGRPRVDGGATGSGVVLVVSGASGATLLEIRGVRPHESLGASVAFIGDVIDDGRGDFVVGASEFDSSVSLFDSEPTSFESLEEGGRSRNYVIFADGRHVEERPYLQGRLAVRAVGAGYVSARSGCDGSEIWRVRGEKQGDSFGASVAAPSLSFGASTRELLVQSSLLSDEPVRVLSSIDGAALGSFPHCFGSANWSGDIDGDGRLDVHLDPGDEEFLDSRMFGARFLTRSTFAEGFRLAYPVWQSSEGVTVALGDIDADGIDDIAFGEAHFNLSGPEAWMTAEQVLDVSRLPLERAVALDAGSGAESGCAVVYSGRTRKVIFGVWARAGSRQGLGLQVAAVDDLSGDGMPDILVTDLNTAYVFAGPGRVPRETGK
ncbi:MAG: hypothetical protein K8S98_09240 [Planctomycetes bacterium]|nr:hypothetical protein [Planctomycetota bacterium]